MRASTVHDAIALLRKREPERTEAVLDRIPGASLQRITSASRMSWISIEHDHWFPDSVLEVLGPGDAAQFFRALLPTMIQMPLLATVVRTTDRLFGLDPGSLAWATQRAWPLVFRGFCTLKVVERRPDHCHMLGQDWHPDVLGFPGYACSIRGVFHSFFDVSGVDGELRFEMDRPARTSRITWTWRS